MRRSITAMVTVLFLLIILIPGVVQAVPARISFQGFLEDASGPVSDSLSIIFRLFDAETGTTPLWEESQAGVVVAQGIYNVTLGTGTINAAYRTLEEAILTSDELWLEVQIDGEADPMSPRQAIASTVFAIKAGNTDRLGGLTLTDLNAAYINTDEIDAIHSGMIADDSISADDLAPDSVTNAELADDAVESDNILDGSIEPEDLSYDYVRATGDTMTGDLTIQADLSVYGESIGVLGEATGADGNRYGVFGRATVSGDDRINYGVLARAASSDHNAYGFYSEVDLSTSESNLGYGAYLYVYTDAASTGTIYGARATVTHSGTSGAAYGYRAAVYPSDTGNAYGIFSAVAAGDTSGDAFAGYFSGDVGVTGNLMVSGTLSKGGGAFKIDHPRDPENKYLQHSFVESPDMMNVYNGNVVLDGNGEAVVDLPEYFDALNRDFRYQLTCIGGFAPIYIAEKIVDNRFKIAGGKAGMEVSWQITGIRKDAWAEANRIEVVIEKDDEEKGSYLYPEAAGISYSKSVEFVRHPEMIVE